MRKSRNEILSECLLNVDEDILANAYEIDSPDKLKQYIKKKNAKIKKPFYVMPLFRKAIAVAACLILVVAAVTSIPTWHTSHTGDPIQSTPNSSDTNNVIYVVADEEDTYGLGLESIKSRDEQYISPGLQKKMQTYHGKNAVYKVIVEIFITAEDYNEFSADEEDEELLLLYDQSVKASEDYEKALAKLVGVDEGREELYEQLEIEKKEKIKKELFRKYDECLRKLEDEYCKNIADTRLEAASKLSQVVPVRVSDKSGVSLYAAYDHYAYFMDLTAEDINTLSQKGGYLFRLTSSSDDNMPYLYQE